MNLSALIRDWLPMAQPLGASESFFLWVDAVGGYWVCMKDEVTLGQPGGKCDIPILADLSQRHALIRRDCEGYTIEAFREVSVDNRPVNHVAALRDGCTLRLGSGLQLTYRQPYALSATARLDFVSRHRTQPSVDGILLMAETCVLGPRSHCHVVCHDWPEEVILFCQDRQLHCRTAGEFEVDGARYRGRARLTSNSRVAGEGFSFGLEAIA